jgi:hypothetical protein
MASNSRASLAGQDAAAGVFSAGLVPEVSDFAPSALPSDELVLSDVLAADLPFDAADFFASWRLSVR